MTAQFALVELLERLAASRGVPVLVGSHDLNDWPLAEVVAMKTQKLLIKARESSSVVCPGCEQECLMRVHKTEDTTGTLRAFTVCDKRDDIARVNVSLDRLLQWQCDVDAVCKFIAECLGFRRSEMKPEVMNLWPICVAVGKKRSQMLCLRAGRTLELLAGENALPLVDLVAFVNDAYIVNSVIVRQLVDSATAADPRYTPSATRREAGKLATQARYKAWQRAYRELLRKRPDMSHVWYSQQIAKSAAAQGRDADTIKKHMTT